MMLNQEPTMALAATDSYYSTGTLKDEDKNKAQPSHLSFYL